MGMMERIIEIRLECTMGTSNKFWFGQVHREKAPGSPPKYKFVASFGPIGHPGQSNEKPQPTCHGAFKMLMAKIKEKLKKGYRLADGSNATVYEEKHFEYDLKLMIAKFAWDYSHLFAGGTPKIKNIETWADKAEKPKEVKREEAKAAWLKTEEKSGESFDWDEPVFGKSSKPKPKIDRKPLVLI